MVIKSAEGGTTVKVGQVSRDYGIPIDTINYYVKLGLLAPPQKGGQRNFDKKTVEDLELILELKELYFSLNEIHRILSLIRISDLASKQDAEELIALYIEKKRYCIGESERLLHAARVLDNRASELNCKISMDAPHTGVPLRLLELIRCPVCGSELGVSGAVMNTRYIFSGSLTCSCGYGAQIENGILLTPNKNMDIYDKPDVARNTYKGLPPHLITLFEHSYNWMLERINEIDFAGKVVMETYVNAYFFMHNHQQYLDPAGRYIVVDKYPETLLAYKQIIEKQGVERDILYIADSSTKLPLKNNCVDVNIDFFAINEHNFYHRSFLLARLMPFLANDAYLLGTYFYFQNGVKSMRNLLREYPTCAEYNFNAAYFLRALSDAGLEMRDSENVGFTTDSGDNIGFSFHAKGEQMHLLSYLAQHTNRLD